MKWIATLLTFITITLAACGTQAIRQSDHHLQKSNVATQATLPINPRPVILPPPKASIPAATYSVVVTNLPAHEILFALARDANLNIDIAPGVQGNVTLNAINQTLPQILERIAKQVDIRYELDNNYLLVQPDSPFLKTYQINYVNMSRDTDGGISNATQIGGSGNPNPASLVAGNNSQVAIKNASKNHFWERLEQNVKDLLRETDKILPEGSSETIVEQNSSTSNSNVPVAQTANNNNRRQTNKSPSAPPTVLSGVVEGEGSTVTRRSTFREAAAVISNPETGLMSVRATAHQHERIQEFLTHIMNNARRQVLIEATIAEVHLSKNYQQGINWSTLRLGTGGFQMSQASNGSLSASNNGSLFKLDYANPVSAIGALAASVSLLESFGDVKVLSSPKLSVMNNQTAMLRVVDNLVYFSIKADTTTNQTTSTTIYTTTATTVPIGFTMSITPQINESDTVQLNLRPSITRLLGYVNDPNPSLSAVGVVSRIPQTQSREMESILSIENNQIAVLGGLMQDEINNQADTVPFLATLPLIGGLFKNRNDTTTKTELVIFIRPTVIKKSSLNGDFSEFRNSLANSDFIKSESEKSALVKADKNISPPP